MHPRKIKNELKGHDCITVPEAGLAGKKNGALLKLARENGFEVFITLDKGIEYQQNLETIEIGIILMRAESSRFGTLKLLIPQVLKVLQDIRAGELIRVGRT